MGIQNCFRPVTAMCLPFFTFPNGIVYCCHSGLISSLYGVCVCVCVWSKETINNFSFQLIGVWIKRNHIWTYCRCQHKILGLGCFRIFSSRRLRVYFECKEKIHQYLRPYGWTVVNYIIIQQIFTLSFSHLHRKRILLSPINVSLAIWPCEQHRKGQCPSCKGRLYEALKVSEVFLH